MKPKLQQFREKYGLTSKKSSVYGEADMVVYVKDIGLVVLEVKRSLQELGKGSDQCFRMSDFSSITFQEFKPGKQLPVVKAVLVGESLNKSSSDGISPPCHKDEDRGVWVLYHEAIESEDAFRKCWERILLDLQHEKYNSTASENKSPTGLRQAKSQFHSADDNHEASVDGFEDFVSLMTGIWSMVNFNGTFNYKGK